MKLYDVEQVAQNELVDTGQDNGPAFDKSTTGGKYKNLKFEGFEI